MLSNGTLNAASAADTKKQNHQYPTRQGGMASDEQYDAKPSFGNGHRSLRGSNGAAAMSGYPRGSNAKKDQRHVVFQLIDPKDPRIQARLPMRVMIQPHDTTESIITTVKNFYGLYEYGVSFENKDGIGIIAAFDNFENDMTVYVRTVASPPSIVADQRDSASPKKLLGAAFEMRPPSHSLNHSPSRTAHRSAGARSVSPQSDLGRRSLSAAPSGKPRPSRTKSKDNSVAGDADGYSSGDNENASVTSSRRSKAEEIKAEITVDNIVEGGRRKRAFESSVSSLSLHNICSMLFTASGTPIVCATASPDERFNLIDLSSTSRRPKCLAIPQHKSAHVLLQPCHAFAPKLRVGVHAPAISQQPIPQWVPTTEQAAARRPS